MKKATQQKILKALNQAFADLFHLMRGLGIPEEVVFQSFGAIMRENGIGARFLLDSAGSFIPVTSPANVGAEQVEQGLARFRSGELAASLATEPEPTPEALSQFLSIIKSALPNLRQHLDVAVKLGPRHRRGGRKKIKKLDDPAVRHEIRETIKGLRSSENTLQELFERMGKRYGASAATIKRRAWLEKMDQK